MADETRKFNPFFAQVLTGNTILALTDDGRTYFLDNAAGFIVTLPAPVLGMKFEFILKTSVTSNLTIVTNGSANILCGSVYSSDLNSASDAAFTATADRDTVTFVANKALKNDRVRLWSDGTSWYMHGFCTVFDAITMSQAS